MFSNHTDEHDHLTPDCPVCRERVGLHNDGVLMLRGQFFHNREEGYAMFILDPDIKISVVEIPDALGVGSPQMAIIVDPTPTGPVFAAHAQCVEDELSAVDDDEDDDDDIDELDEQMHDAIERDMSRERIWDEHDMMNREP